MTGALLRTGSIPVHRHNFTGSPTSTLFIRLHDPLSDAVNVLSPKFDFHRSPAPTPGIRRSVSVTNIYRSPRISAVGSFSAGIVQADDEIEIQSRYVPGVGDLGLGNGFPGDEDEFPGGGIGNGRRCRGDGRGAGGGREEDRSGFGEYYQRMLKKNPSDSLLLRNYGKYLHEVEKDTVRAEVCYGRAILASPGDGELLSLYGNLIWETHRDGERAKSYFDRAVRAAPGDSTVLGSYAHFLWEADEEGKEDEEEGIKTKVTAINSVLISKKG